MVKAFPRSLVFVVQFSSDADPSHGHLLGRVEHVDSGESARFASAEEMNEFFARVLREVKEPGTTGNNENSAQQH